MGMGGQRHAPTALPPGKTRYPLYRRLGGAKGRSGRVRKISPPPGFDRRTVHPVASRLVRIVTTGTEKVNQSNKNQTQWNRNEVRRRLWLKELREEEEEEE
jgi:hypothetical protein